MFFVIFVTMNKIIFIAFFLPMTLFGQDYFKNHLGGTIGLSVNFGSHINGVGINLKGYYTDYFAQINATSTFYFYGNHYGGRKNFFESRHAIGLILLAGKKEMDVDFQLDGLNHQTPYNYGLGYNFILYYDNAGTSQRSGGIGIHMKNASLYHENDVFGGQAKDRFRTGHFYATYRYNDFKFGLGLNLWTGETANSTWQKVPSDKCPSGFRILEDLPYGKTSHGIAYGSVIYNLPYGQIAHLRLGVDSEQIRHGIQNRLIHDLMLLPKKITRNTPHYPRLGDDGCPVFNRDDIRPSLLYMQFGLNNGWSY